MQETLPAIATDSASGAASWTVFDLVGDLPPTETSYRLPARCSARAFDRQPRHA
ncbi:hypothetical protein [Streptomyces sp. NPDC048436]|uniref:hypothetical protein n=1 Tax=Streptomyces sp. NPDC048436 TaxID=3365550 RepID=UPI0037149AB4